MKIQTCVTSFHTRLDGNEPNKSYKTHHVRMRTRAVLLKNFGVGMEIMNSKSLAEDRDVLDNLLQELLAHHCNNQCCPTSAGKIGASLQEIKSSAMIAYEGSECNSRQHMICRLMMLQSLVHLISKQWQSIVQIFPAGLRSFEGLEPGLRLPMEGHVQLLSQWRQWRLKQPPLRIPLPWIAYTKNQNSEASVSVCCLLCADQCTRMRAVGAELLAAPNEKHIKRQKLLYL